MLLAEELNRRGHVEDIGGYGYLGELWDAAPTAANAVHYAKIVKDKALLRFLIHTSTEILRDAYDQVQPAEELVQAAERKVFAVGGDPSTLGPSPSISRWRSPRIGSTAGRRWARPCAASPRASRRSMRSPAAFSRAS